MRARVVYESHFGNTKAIAEAIADGLRGRCEVEVREVEGATSRLDGIDLVVVGGPTHAWSMSRGITREDARKQARTHGVTPPSAGTGIREWVAALGRPPAALRAAVFDTAIRPNGWFPVGSAAEAAARRLEDRGLRLVLEPEQFHVKAVDGPLDAGEIERARAWGIRLAARRFEGQVVSHRRGRRPGERIGDVVANVLGLLLINLHALWRPWTMGVVTAAWADVVVVASVAAALGVLGSLLALALRARRLVALVDVVIAAASLGSTAVIYQVFPFDFGAIGMPWVELVLRGVLILAMLVLGVRLLAALFRALRFG
ncbi:MAG: flavodoxin domain-containing protein [Nannocystaceae bacterium]